MIKETSEDATMEIRSELARKFLDVAENGDAYGREPVAKRMGHGLRELA